MQNQILVGPKRLRIVLTIALGWFCVGLHGQEANVEAGGQSAQPRVPESAAVQELTKPQLDAIRIPKDAKGPIFVYDQTGGFGVAPPADRLPDFQLFADGKLVIGGSSYGRPKFESTLKPTELTAFLNLVVNENRFYDLDEKEIEKQMLAGKEAVKLMDAATTRFAVDLQQGKKEVAVYALWNAVENYPEIDELQRLSKIEKRCKEMIYKIHLGDDGEEVLKAVNEAVEKLGQNIAPFTMDEIQNATRLTTGRFQVRFERQLAPGKTENNVTSPPKTLHAIYFRKDTQTEPTVSFYGLPKK